MTSLTQKLAQGALTGQGRSDDFEIKTSEGTAIFRVCELRYQQRQDIVRMYEEIEDLDEDNMTKEEQSDAMEQLMLDVMVMCVRDPDTDQLLWDEDDVPDLLHNGPMWLGSLAAKAMEINGLINKGAAKKSQNGKRQKKQKKKTRKTRKKRVRR